MPYIYNADCWCDSCGSAIRERILAESSVADRERFQDEIAYDSDEFPKYMSEDEESDCPQHCAAREDCLEAETLDDDSRIGALLSTSLTTDGVDYVKAECMEDSAVTRFWRSAFDWVDFDPIQFESPLYDGDTIDVDGFQVSVRIVPDEHHDHPWDNEDGHGTVSDWERKEHKQPGQCILIEDRGLCRFYDWQSAIETAKREGWDAEPFGQGTKGQRAERAVQRDFERLRQYCEGQWHYVGVVLSVSRNGIELDNHAASLWGIESDANDWFAETVNELLDEAIEAGRKAIDALKADEADSLTFRKRRESQCN